MITFFEGSAPCIWSTADYVFINSVWIFSSWSCGIKQWRVFQINESNFFVSEIPDLSWTSGTFFSSSLTFWQIYSAIKCVFFCAKIHDYFLNFFNFFRINLADENPYQSSEFLKNSFSFKLPQSNLAFKLFIVHTSLFVADQQPDSHRVGCREVGCHLWLSGCWCRLAADDLVWLSLLITHHSCQCDCLVQVAGGQESWLACAGASWLSDSLGFQTEKWKMKNRNWLENENQNGSFFRN